MDKIKLEKLKELIETIDEEKEVFIETQDIIEEYEENIKKVKTKEKTK